MIDHTKHILSLPRLKTSFFPHLIKTSALMSLLNHEGKPHWVGLRGGAPPPPPPPPPPASMGTSSGSVSTFFVASSSITRTSRFSCGFCQGFRFPSKYNTFVGNCFLKILGSARNVQLSAGRK